MAEIAALQARIKELEAKLEDSQKSGMAQARQKITQMSSEVVDSNPYR